MQTMRTLAQPLVKLTLTFAAGLIADLPPMRIVLRKTKCLRIQTAGQGRRMPAPLRHRAERHRVFVRSRKRLQSGYVRGESKFAVAYGQRRERIEFVERRTVTI